MQGALDHAIIRAGNERIRAQHDQCLDLTLIDLLKQLVGGDAFAWELARIDAPHFRHMLACGGIFDQPVPRELVGLLPMLAAALTVRLTGHSSVAAA
ncbi:hypothetical protein D3C85_1089490 [compost metagenome]